MRFALTLHRKLARDTAGPVEVVYHQWVPRARQGDEDRTLSATGMGTGPLLAGQTMLVIGGSSGIGLETARRGREEGATVIITARDPERVHQAGIELGASIAAFDATDFERLGRFFDELGTPIDHVLVTGPVPRVGPLSSYDVEAVRGDLDAHMVLPLQVARGAATTIRSAGTMTFIGCIDSARSPAG